MNSFFSGYHSQRSAALHLICTSAENLQETVGWGVTSEEPARNLFCYLAKLPKKKTNKRNPKCFLLVREQQKKKIRFANSSSLAGTGTDLELAVFCAWRLPASCTCTERRHCKQ